MGCALEDWHNSAQPKSKLAYTQSFIRTIDRCLSVRIEGCSQSIEEVENLIESGASFEALQKDLK